MSKANDKFNHFPADTKDPIGKYTQPKQNPRVTHGRQGYPAEDIDREGTMTYGRYIKGKGDKKKLISRTLRSLTKQQTW